MECPYKDCVWAATALQEAPTMTDAEAEDAARMWDQANAAAVESAKAGAEAATGAAEATEDNMDMDTGAARGTAPIPNPPKTLPR